MRSIDDLRRDALKALAVDFDPARYVLGAANRRDLLAVRIGASEAQWHVKYGPTGGRYEEWQALEALTRGLAEEMRKAGCVERHLGERHSQPAAKTEQAP